MQGINTSSQAVAEKVQDTLEDKREAVVDQAQKSYDQMKTKASEAADNFSRKTDAAKQEMKNRMIDYDRKLEEVADRLPGDVTQTVTRYPWVTLVAVTLLGFVAGMWLKPCFKRYEYKYQYPQE